MKNFEQLIRTIDTAITSEDVDLVSPAIGQWLQVGTPNQKVALQTAVSQLNARLTLMTTQALEQSGRFLSQNGRQYPLSDWLTPKEYAKRFDIQSTQVITNWIRRGVIPKEKVVIIQELNNLTLIKAMPYR